jgi:hypothetical protein
MIFKNAALLVGETRRVGGSPKLHTSIFILPMSPAMTTSFRRTTSVSFKLNLVFVVMEVRTICV